PPYQEASIQSNGSGMGFPTMSAAASGGTTPQPASFPGGAPSIPSDRSSPSAGDQTPQTQAPTADAHQDPRFKIAVDEGKNSILMEATPADHRRIMQVIRNLDVMPKQVLIEVTVAEITLTDELKFGVRWFFQGKGGRSYTFSDDLGGALSSVFPGFSYALTA